MKNIFLFATLLVVSAVFTSCNNDDDLTPNGFFVVLQPEKTAFVSVAEGVSYATVQYNPQRVQAVDGRLIVQGYGGEYGAYTYPVQIVNPADSTIANIGTGTHIATYGGVVYVANSHTEDWITYSNTFYAYNVTSGLMTKDLLEGAPEELATANVYMFQVNPANGHLYIGTNVDGVSTNIYHFDSDGNYIEQFACEGVMVNSATFLDGNIYFLAEGQWNANNAEIYLLRKGEKTLAPLYSTANGGAKLGDLAQSMVEAGDALYVVVAGSKYIAKLGLDGKELARYTCTEADDQPRYVVAYQGNIYVTTYAGKILKFDFDLNRQGEVGVGNNPEQIIISKGLLYTVCNGWGYDNRLFIVDPTIAFK